jgi:hypothetical protein
MKRNVILETRPTPNGRFRADVADGPDWLRGYCVAETASSAYHDLAYKIRIDYPRSTFDFMHLEGQ